MNFFKKSGLVLNQPIGYLSLASIFSVVAAVVKQQISNSPALVKDSVDLKPCVGWFRK